MKFFLFVMLLWGNYILTECASLSKRSCKKIGFDISTLCTVNEFRTLRRDHSYVIIRAYRSNGQVDTNAPANIQNARQAGFTDISVYMVPCPNCSKTAAQQVQEMMNPLQNSQFSQIWLVVTNLSSWNTNTVTNRNFFNNLVTAAKATGKSVGVYTSDVQWRDIMGCDFTIHRSLPLWYARYNGLQTPRLSDYNSLGLTPHCGNWARAVMKQYAQNVQSGTKRINKNRRL